MLSTANLLSPADGSPVVAPTQDMVLGCYYLTYAEDSEEGNQARVDLASQIREGERRVQSFSGIAEIVMARREQ